MKKGHGPLYALIAFMVFVWSANFIVAKVALRHFPALLLAGMRAAVAAAFLLPAYWWRRRRNQEQWTREDLPGLAWLALFGVALNQFLFVVGLSRTSVAHSAIIAGLSPILVLTIASVVGLERFTSRKVAGMAVALMGVAILKSFEHAGSGATWQGDLCIFLGGLSFALFTVFGKQATLRYSSLTVNTFAYAGGALALLPVTLWAGWRFPFAHVGAGGWLALVYMALFPSVIAYLIYYYALRRIAATRLSAFSYLQPLLATAMGVALLGEPLTTPVIAGGAVIFGGVYLAERG
ncbi:MAG: DMT family transporter [Bryobacteraceae bacterium]